MKRSSVIPYEGEEPYIFISYCHKDRKFVYPIIERLAAAGYRIWYDGGIIPASLWVEVIADNLSRASVCIAFISENAGASHNCKREINYAVLKKKPLLPVFLEETKLSVGVEMQLSDYQWVRAHAFADVEKCLQAIMSAKDLTPCQGEPNPTIEVRSPEYYGDSEAKAENSEEPKGPGNDWFNSDNAVKERTRLEEEERKKREEETKEYVLVRKQTRELIPISGELYVGRDWKTEKEKYKTPDNNKEVGREHFYITSENGTYYITDNNSKNGTLLNGAKLIPYAKTTLNIGDEIRVSNESFTFEIKPTGGDRLV